MRDPHAFTPMLEEGLRGAPPRSLTLGSDLVMNQREISKFSQKDAEANTWKSLTKYAWTCILDLTCCSQVYPDFVKHLAKLAAAIQPLLDAPPVDIIGATTGSLRKRLAAVKTAIPVVKCGVFNNA